MTVSSIESCVATMDRASPFRSAGVGREGKSYYSGQARFLASYLQLAGAGSSAVVKEAGAGLPAVVTGRIAAAAVDSGLVAVTVEVVTAEAAERAALRPAPWPGRAFAT